MRIRLEDFQGHKDSTIETSGGITSITGSTDAGKSSIVRAVRHLQANNLRGKDFIRKGKQTCRITLDNVIREVSSGKGRNGYQVGDSFTEALRTGVPHEVSTELNLSPDAIQSQHNSLFLLDSDKYSPGDIAKKLSELIDLELAHKAVKAVEVDKKAAVTQSNALLLNINRSELRIKELEIIDPLNNQLLQIEAEQALISTETAAYSSLLGIVENAEERAKEVAKLPFLGVLPTTIEGIFAKVEAIDSLERQADYLQVALDSIDTLSMQTALVQDVNELSKDSIDAISLIKSIAEISKAVTIAETNQTKAALSTEKLDMSIAGITKLLNETNFIRTQLDIIQGAQNTAEGAGRTLAVLKQHKKNTLGDECPFCGSILITGEIS